LAHPLRAPLQGEVWDERCIGFLEADNVAHFRDQLRQHHDIPLIYPLSMGQDRPANRRAGRASYPTRRHHQHRPRQPLRGMMLYVDGSHFFHTPKAGGTMVNRYIRVLPWHQRHWTQPAAEPGTAFVPCGNVDLEAIFSVQHERVVLGGLRLQIAPQSPRWSDVQCRDKLCEHLDGRWSVRYGPHVLGWYAARAGR